VGGETPKNVAGLFRAASEQGAVLFFDEADAIAARRSVGSALPQQREANTTVNVLLREIEGFNGVVIFATNLAANFDPAFERRIRTHVRFEMPGVEERARIWHVQIHPAKTPLGDDVNFRDLAERFPASGGDIKNAVLKAAAAAANEPGPDAAKRIHQRHFEAAMEDVVQAKGVMRQSLYELDGAPEDPPRRRGPCRRVAARRGRAGRRARSRALALAAAALAGTACSPQRTALGVVLGRG
jgi:SpoVK/Ycf46/Vps4 family AAA+-type ATPase